MPSQICIHAEVCGKGVAIEHDGSVYACDHYVYPQYKLGNIAQRSVGDMVFSPAQVKFGYAKSETLPAYCRQCQYLNDCWGECPKNRLLRTPDGEAGLNYPVSGAEEILRARRSCGRQAGGEAARDADPGARADVTWTAVRRGAPRPAPARAADRQRFGAALALSVFLTVLGIPAVSGANAPSVLVLYSNGRLLPVNIAADRGVREVLQNDPERPVTLFDEFFDEPRFGGARYEQTMATYLREKYAASPPDVLLAGGDGALAFLLRHRADLFPRAPIVHMSVQPVELRPLAPLPPDVVGVPVQFDYATTIDLALRWHPQARRVVVVTGTSAQDHLFEQQLRRDAERFTGRASFEFVTALPTGAVHKRLRELGSDAIVFTPGYFRDGAGVATTPRQAAEAMAAVSAVPVYGAFEPFIGTGVVAANTPDFKEIGRQGGAFAKALLAGATPASLELPATTPNHLLVDWRQVRRWNIDEAAIPADAVVQFREPTLLEAHRTEVAIALIVVVLQAGLIAVLIAERFRRRVAEQAVEQQRMELAHASRLAVAGELTGSIAHEINQPLGAILANADAADLMLEAGTDRPGEIRAILADIRRDDLRAGEVIRRLRSLLAKHEAERERVDVNDVVSDTEAMLRTEARHRGVTVVVEPAPAAAIVQGDRVQIQQVLINVILNAMDAMSATPPDLRTVVVAVDRVADGVSVVVRDRGAGIADEDMPKLFDSFFSTKRTGMGLGLSIARTLVEAHGGRISAANDAIGGAIFRIELPGIPEAPMSAAASS